MNLFSTKVFLIISTTIAFGFSAWADKIINVGASGNTFSTTTTPVNISLGEKITFNFVGGFHNAESVSIPAGAVSFTSGSAPSSGSFNYTPTAAGVYTFKCIIHSASGMIGSFTVTGTAATPSITTGQLNSLTICGGTTIQFPFTATGTFTNDGMFVAQLSNMSGSFSNATVLASSLATPNLMNATIPSAIANGGQYRIRVIYTSAIGNINGSDNGQNLRLDPVAVPSIIIASSASGSICIGTPVTVSSSIGNAQNVISSNWVLNGSITSVLGSTYKSNTILNNDNLLLVRTVQTGGIGACPLQTAVLTSNGVTFSILNNVVPSVNISSIASFADDCLGLTTFHVIALTASGIGSFPTYKWYVDDQLTILTGTEITVVGFASVYVNAASSLSCASTATVNSAILMFPDSTVERVSSIVHNNNGLTYSNPFGNPGNQFQWLLNNIPVAGANQKSFTPALLGTYSCIVTFPGCVQTIVGKNITITGTSTDDSIMPSDIAIYPNPTTDKIFISVKGSTYKSELVSYVYNLEGKKLLEKPFESATCKSGKGKQCLCPGVDEVDVSSLQSGTYIVFVTDGFRTLFRKKIEIQ